jgi:hypothetical protein
MSCCSHQGSTACSIARSARVHVFREPATALARPNNAIISRLNTGMSSGFRLDTMLPSTTAS